MKIDEMWPIIPHLFVHMFSFVIADSSNMMIISEQHLTCEIEFSADIYIYSTSYKFFCIMKRGQLMTTDGLNLAFQKTKVTSAWTALVNHSVLEFWYLLANQATFI